MVAEARGLGVRAISVQGDITQQADVQAMRERIETELGSPDILVNNAVIQYDWTSVLTQPLADYEGQFRSSVLHNVLMAQVFVPAMIERGWGRVIGINTECAMQNLPTQSAYVAGKRGMDGVLRVLAREVGEHQITVNQVAPGWMISEDKPDGEDDAAYTGRACRCAAGARTRTSPIWWRIWRLIWRTSSPGQYISVSGGNVMPTI